MGQRHVGNAVAKAFREGGRALDRQRGLADPAETDKGQEPDIGPRQLVGNEPLLGGAADEGRELGREREAATRRGRPRGGR